MVPCIVEIYNYCYRCDGFRKLLDYLDLGKVHLFGASLGGYMAQKFAECSCSCQRVASLILCNSFSDTSIFKGNESSSLYWMLPSLVLKRMLLSNFKLAGTNDIDVVRTVDFMVEKVCLPGKYSIYFNIGFLVGQSFPSGLG